jgi:hypothetical protein
MAGRWTVGPDFPNGDNAGDSFAVLLPSGHVLVFGVSGTLYEFDGTRFIRSGASSAAPLLLPTGQVLLLANTASLYTAAGTPQPSWAPRIVGFPANVTRGLSYVISGTQFNGLSQAMAFGDELENPTNYPLVRIANRVTGHVFYARTHDHSTMAVATGAQLVSTHFDVPQSAEPGPSYLQVVANGIPSPPVNVTVI